MPASLLTREEILKRLLKIFRSCGYQGASLTLISAETGLGKASLYHHFPGGKDQMVSEVLDYVGGLLRENVLDPLDGNGTPLERVQDMIQTVESFYDRGSEACVFESLSLNAGSDAAKVEINTQMRAWIKSMANVSRESGYSVKEAKENAEQAMISIQGALVVSRATGDQKVFIRTLKLLPQQLLKS